MAGQKLLWCWLAVVLATGTARANLIVNGSFEATPCSTPCQLSQGVLPANWLILNQSPDTYSNDGSFGLPPSGFGNFNGATAHEGLRWVAGWSSAAEIFGQSLASPLESGKTYTLTAYLREAVRSDLAHPGTYQVELWSVANNSADKLVLGRFEPAIANQSAWELRSLTFIAPAGSSTHLVLAFRPVDVGQGSTYPGIDDVVLLAAAPVDLTPPNVTAPDDARFSCASELPAAAVELALATDDVGVVSLTLSETSNGGAGSTASPLVVTRTWTATDASGKSGTDTQTITIIDDLPPFGGASGPTATHTSRAGFEAAAGPGLQEEDFDGYAAGLDVGSLFGGLVSFASPFPTVFYGNWQSTNFSGGGLIPEPRFQGRPLALTFTKPVTAVGARVFDDFDGSPFVNVVTLTVTTRSGATFVVSESSPTAGDAGFLGATSREGIVSAQFSIDNTNGNLEIDHLVVSTSRPFLAPPPIVVTTGPGVGACGEVRVRVADLGDMTVEDNCGAAVLSVAGVPEGDLYPVGQTLVSYTATDGVGNTSIATQTVTVLCPTASLAGSVSLACNGTTQPAAGVIMRLLHEGQAFRESLSDATGRYEFTDVRLGSYTVQAVPPAGYGSAVDTRVVTLSTASTELGVTPFEFTCLLAEIAGRVEAVCNDATVGLSGVTVDLYHSQDGVDLLLGSVPTDPTGAFRFGDVALGEYSLGVVVPLGYSVASPSEAVSLTLPGALVTAEPFTLSCLAIVAQPRGVGYWKHQVNTYLTGKGRAQESLDDLLGYLDRMVEHFNQNLVNPVIVYLPSGTTSGDRLLQLQQLLTVNKGGTDLDRAKQQLLALLLNVVSGKIAQTQEVSDNGATVSQAITHAHDLIMDGIQGNDATAASLLGMVNDSQRVPAGMIPSGTRVITYSNTPATGGPISLAVGPISPNPASGNASIVLTLPRSAPAMLEVVDLTGRRAASLDLGERSAGRHSIRLSELGRLQPGVYLVRLSQDEGTAIKRLTIIR